MKQLLYYSRITFFSLLLTATACQKGDNYPAPNANIQGALLDAITGEPFQSEQPNGFRMKWTELSYGGNVQPDYFWGMQDGRFNWDHAFGYAGSKYEIVPVEGAFVAPEPQTFSLAAGGSAKIDFKVIPLLHIRETHTLSGAELTVNYTVSRPQGSGNGTLQTSRVLISDKTTYIGRANQGGFVDALSSPQHNLAEAELGNTLTEKITLQSGKTYYMRVAASVVNPSGRTNYTPVVTITVP